MRTRRIGGEVIHPQMLDALSHRSRPLQPRPPAVRERHPGTANAVTKREARALPVVHGQECGDLVRNGESPNTSTQTLQIRHRRLDEFFDERNRLRSIDESLTHGHRRKGNEPCPANYRPHIGSVHLRGGAQHRAGSVVGRHVLLLLRRIGTFGGLLETSSTGPGRDLSKCRWAVAMSSSRTTPNTQTDGQFPLGVGSPPRPEAIHNERRYEDTRL
jgi:hypothetical protein